MAVGVTQPGGAGTTIYIYDDASSASGTGYTFTEISAAFPADFVDNGTNRRSYRAKVSLQIGDTTTNAATTTLADTNATVIFDSGKTLLARGTQTTSWYLRLGTKIGTGNQASGKDGCEIVLGAAPSWPRQSFCYGCTFAQTSGAFLQTSTDNTGEYVNCIFQSKSTGTAPLSFGTAAAAFSNLYNVDISHVTTAQVLSNFAAYTAERVTIAAAAPTTFLNSNATGVSVKDLAMFGSPTQSDLRWTNSGATLWTLVRPKFTGNAPKFSMQSGVASISLANATVEYWIWGVKCVDGTGAGVSGIPVKLTDTVGNVQVDTTTDANGEISFGSGLTENAVAVLDHYATSGTYLQRHRSPFLAEINLPTQSGYNNNYRSHKYLFNWPGYSSITTSAGSFDDVADIIQMQDYPGNPTIWTEASI